VHQSHPAQLHAPGNSLQQHNATILLLTAVFGLARVLSEEGIFKLQEQLSQFDVSRLSSVSLVSPRAATTSVQSVSSNSPGKSWQSVQSSPATSDVSPVSSEVSGLTELTDSQSEYNGTEGKVFGG
jgi:hypothetical protein